MDQQVRRIQYDILEVFKKKTKVFSLSGGTALELFYLNHRFSADLDFFSPQYELKEIDELIFYFKKFLNCKIKLEQELMLPQKARVRFYTASFKETKRPLKIDFVEDVIFKKPQIVNIEGLRVYSVENIYLQKIYAVAGMSPQMDEIGRVFVTGRGEARDVFDIYMLSKKIKPLSLMLKEVSGATQRGMVHWYSTFSRRGLKISLLDLDIYDKKFDASEMIAYLEAEIKRFIKEEFLR